MLRLLPFHKIETRNPGPLARDGHGMIAVEDQMYIAGGNSPKGPLKDLWKLDTSRREWKRLADMSGLPRYSFSMHLLWKHYIIVFGGCPGIRNTNLMLNDLMIYDIENDGWTRKEYNQQSPIPKPRCRHGSNIIIRENGIAEMYVFGGYCGEGYKMKDVWKATFTARGKDIDVLWERLPDMKRKTHRCFSFSLDDSVFLVGGFGRSVMKLQEVIGSDQTIVTHDLLNLPASEKKAFRESKSLAGFGAVYDDIEQRLIVVGGGNVGHSDKRKQTNKPTKEFGPVDGCVMSKPRILYLKHNKDSKKYDEWKWTNHELYESLEKDYHLPKLLSWSATLIGTCGPCPAYVETP